MARKNNGTKAPTRGGQLLDQNLVGDSRSEVAEKMIVSVSLVDRWISGERKPTPTQVSRLAEIYGIPVEAWRPPVERSSVKAPSARKLRDRTPLSPWLVRLCREGITGVDDDDEERERTAEVIASTLKDHPELIDAALVGPLAKHPETIADILEALRPYAGEAAEARGT